MRYKQIGTTGVEVSEAAIGTWAIGDFGVGEEKEKQSVAAIRTMLEGGVNLIDTAPAYGGGRAERVTAKALEGLKRSDYLISTKCGITETTVRYKRKREEGVVYDSSYANILYECEQSLRRLHTDYIDFYFVHWPDYDTPFEETMEAMLQLKKEGKIRFVGVSNFSREQIEECERICPIDVIQPQYSMVARKEEELMKWCAGKGKGIFSYGSLGSGILTGTCRELRTYADNDPKQFFYPFFREPYFSKVMRVLEVMDRISEETGKPLSQIAINWTAQKDYVTTAICGASDERHAAENCEAFAFSLTGQQMSLLDDAINEYLDFLV